MNDTTAAPVAPAAEPVVAAAPAADDVVIDMEAAKAELSAELFPAAKPAVAPAPAAPAAAAAAVVAPAAEVKPAPAAPAPAAPAPAAAPTEPELLKSWRPEARAEFAKLPKVVQDEVLKREGDMQKGFEQIRAEGEIARSFRDVVKPYLPAMQFYNIDPLKQINTLLATQQVLAFGTLEQKLNVVRRIVKDFSIPADQLAAPGAPEVDPAVAAALAPLQAELGAVKSTLTAEQTRIANERREAFTSQVAKFAADPSHPYFDELSDTIADLIAKGVAKDLQDAYDKALWQNPATRAKEQQRLSDEAAAKAKSEATAAVERARAATAANVTTSAKTAASATAPTVGTMDDTIAATMAAIKARSASQ